MDSELEFLIVEGHNYSDAVELFRIYNSSGTALNSQEIRNGIYQNNCLYKKINEYSDKILTENKNKQHNWYKFNSTNIKGDKSDIKKLFQLLAYHFSFSMNVTKSKDDKLLFEPRNSILFNFLKNKKTETIYKSELKNYKIHYRKND